MLSYNVVQCVTCLDHIASGNGVQKFNGGVHSDAQQCHAESTHICRAGTHLQCTSLIVASMFVTIVPVITKQVSSHVFYTC